MVCSVFPRFPKFLRKIKVESEETKPLNDIRHLFRQKYDELGPLR
jgi:hypothetical protein